MITVTQSMWNLMIIVCVDFKGACFSKKELAAVWLRFICVNKSSNRAFRPYQSNSDHDKCTKWIAFHCATVKPSWKTTLKGDLPSVRLETVPLLRPLFLLKFFMFPCRLTTRFLKSTFLKMFTFIIMGSGHSSVVSALDSWSKGCRFESPQEWQKNVILQGQLFVLLFWYPFHPCVTQ